MSSPAKRRKLNKDVSEKPQTRKLESFFASQTKKQETSNIVDNNSGLPQSSPPETTQDSLTDEELARKLQEEWNREDQHEEASIAPAENVEPENHDRALPHDLSLPDHVEKQTLSNNGQDGFTKGVVDVPKAETLSLQAATATEDTITQTVQFDQSPLTFDPSAVLPELKQQWSREGGSATYALLTRCFVLVNSTQSRIRIVDNLVNMLRVIIEGDPDSLQATVWLATNSISPPYIDLELGLGGSAISKALKKVCGLDNPGLKRLYDKHGDAGDVAFEAKKRQSLTLRKPKPLTIKSVYESLVKIATSKGTGSVETKQRIVEKLVQDARGAEESRYIVRTLVQHLRIGAVKTTMLVALSRAFLLSKPPNASFSVRDRHELAKLKKEELQETWARSEEIVKACFSRRPNYNDLIPALLEIGVCNELLIRCGLGLHVPLRPMLGNITRDLGDMLTKLQGRDFSCEYKYDGQRAQVHCDSSGKVTIFSRHLELMTEKYPDLVAIVPKIRGDGVSSFILEGEVVAIDPDTGDLKTFQTLANRARKDVAMDTVKVDVCLFAFDLMYLNGEELLDRPFRERRSLLRSLFIEVPKQFTWVKSLDATSGESETILEFFKSATDIKCEGIMVKILDNLPKTGTALDGPEEDQQQQQPEKPRSKPATPKKSKKPTKPKFSENPDDNEPQQKEKGSRRKALLSTYEPDKRVDSWLKVKKDYDTAADTLDLIPVAGWHGQGRKAKWWSPILLATRNPETGCLEAVTKCISGFTDKFYQANKEKYSEDGDNAIARPSYVEYAGSPDIWFEPQEVWEMAYADITLSPTYTSAIGLISEERGLSLRFPRFLKVREDKSIEEATTSDQLAALYRLQERRTKEGGPAPVIEEDGEE